jgi:hypothetical protein
MRDAHFPFPSIEDDRTIGASRISLHREMSF